MHDRYSGKTQIRIKKTSIIVYPFFFLSCTSHLPSRALLAGDFAAVIKTVGSRNYKKKDRESRMCALRSSGLKRDSQSVKTTASGIRGNLLDRPFKRVDPEAGEETNGRRKDGKKKERRRDRKRGADRAQEYHAGSSDGGREDVAGLSAAIASSLAGARAEAGPRRPGTIAYLYSYLSS